MNLRKRICGVHRHAPITENTGNGVPAGLLGQLRLCCNFLKAYQQAVKQLKVEGSIVGQSLPFLDSLNLIFRPIEEIEVKVVVTRKKEQDAFRKGIAAFCEANPWYPHDVLVHDPISGKVGYVVGRHLDDGACGFMEVFDGEDVTGEYLCVEPRSCKPVKVEAA